jgi:hypothetical protein
MGRPIFFLLKYLPNKAEGERFNYLPPWDRGLRRLTCE